jgi:DNA end-binding protein Ku
VKGFEVSKGNYYIFEKEDFEKLKPEKTQSISILEFIDREQMALSILIHNIMLHRNWKKTRHSNLFKTVLQSTNKIAIGRFVMREKSIPAQYTLTSQVYC